MKKLTKIFTGLVILFAASSSLFAQSAKRTPISSTEINIIQSLQNSFRSISENMLPAVVEVDVSETKTYKDPFGDLAALGSTFLVLQNQKMKRRITRKSTNQRGLVQV